LIVGQALLARGDLVQVLLWGVLGDPSKASVALGMIRSVMLAAEEPIVRAVTNFIGAMPSLWLDIDDEPGPERFRAVINRPSVPPSMEGNSIL
jgi:hypothetical protein